MALEAGDIVLVGDDLRHLGGTIQLSLQTLFIIQRSITIALTLNSTFVPLGLFGIIGLSIAVLEDMGSSSLVTLNAMCLLKYSSKKAD